MVLACFVFSITLVTFFVGLLLGRQGCGKVGMDMKISLMDRATSELKTGNLLPGLLEKCSSPGQ